MKNDISIYGLVGFPLGHSFSARYFTEKFQTNNISAEYHNFEIPSIKLLPGIIEKLQSDGYKIVPVSELIMKDNYKIDSTGMQISTKE